MKKLIISTFILIFIATSVLGVSALPTERREVEDVISEIRVSQGIEANGEIDVTRVSDALLEELGDSVMEAFSNSPTVHEQLNQYFAREDAPTLTAIHIQVGEDYLNGYPISMMTFRRYAYSTQTDIATSYYGGMMGRYFSNDDQLNAYQGYGGMMGRYYSSDDQLNAYKGYGGMISWLNNSTNPNSNFDNWNSPIAYYGMMTGFGSAIMFVPIIGLLILTFVFVYWMTSKNGHQTIPATGNAISILKERYARGEITRDEFIQKKDTLK